MASSVDLPDPHTTTHPFNDPTAKRSTETLIFETGNTKFGINLCVPSVALRYHHRGGEKYFVYLIKTEITELANSITESSAHLSNTIQWTVGRRYSELVALHDELLGVPSPNNKCTTSDDEQVGDRVKLFAHACLPRPLPGAELIPFPKRRRIPTLTAVVALYCASSSFSKESGLDHVDVPVHTSRSARVEDRRRDLESYLIRLVDLVWQLSWTPAVNSAFNAMVGHSGHDLIPTTISGVKSRLVALLPILSNQTAFVPKNNKSFQY